MSKTLTGERPGGRQLVCSNCGDTADGPERDCPKPSPGRPYVDCGRGGHMFDKVKPPPKVQVRTEADGRVALAVDDNQNGMTIRLNPETALKLAMALMECAFKAPSPEAKETRP